MSNVALVLLMVLMFIGGSPGSAAGGIKTTTFRALVSFISSQMKGRPQTVVGRYALDGQTLGRALTLAVFAAMTVLAATLALTVTEGGDVSHRLMRGQFLELLFEVVSALSTGVTPTLSPAGKGIVIALMFLGRLGPILFLSMLQAWQTPPHYRWPEERVMIG
jgi:trk system potassium uptake protein TrkH